MNRLSFTEPLQLVLPNHIYNTEPEPGRAVSSVKLLKIKPLGPH